MRALDYVVNRALFYQKPAAVNLSFGNTYGSHDGTSLLETYIDQLSNQWKTVIVTGTGNEGSSRGHAAGRYEMGKDTEIELSVAEYETGFGIQLWKLYADIVELSVVSPGGISTGVLSRRLGAQRIPMGSTELLVYYGKPSPYSQAQEIYLNLLPVGSYVQSGIWKIRLTPRKVAVGQYDLWLPGGGSLNRATRFLVSDPDTTLTIPSTASRVISVGAYDDSYLSYADFSGRGYTRLNTSPRSGDYGSQSGRRLRAGDGNLLCGSLCQRKRRSHDGVGDRQGKRSVSLRGEGEGLPDTGSQASSRRDSLSEPASGVWQAVSGGQFSSLTAAKRRGKDKI